MNHRILLTALTAALSLATRATAAPPPAAPATQKMFAEGQRLFDAGESAGAAALFRKLYETTRSPNAHFMLARSLLALNRLPEAHEEMSVALREATDAAPTDPKRYETTRDAAAAQLALLDRKLGKIVVILVSPDAAATITLGGSPLPLGKLGVPVAVVPGMVTVEKTTPSSPPVRIEVSIAAGETKTIPLSAEKPALRAASDGPAPGPARAPVHEGHLRTAGFVVGGVGVGGLIVGVATGIGALNKLSRLENECGGGRCADLAYASVVDDGKRLQTITNIALTAGTAATVVGGLMIALGGRTVAGREPTVQKLAVGAAPAWGGGALWIAYTF